MYRSLKIKKMYSVVEHNLQIQHFGTCNIRWQTGEFRFGKHKVFPAPECTGWKYMMMMIVMTGGWKKEREQSREEVNNEIILFCTVNSCSNKTAAENFFKKAKGLECCFCAYTVDAHRMCTLHLLHVYTQANACPHESYMHAWRCHLMHLECVSCICPQMFSTGYGTPFGPWAKSLAPRPSGEGNSQAYWHQQKGGIKTLIWRGMLILLFLLVNSPRI